jgi:uncharacterized protein (DUF1778 family)
LLAAFHEIWLSSAASNDHVKLSERDSLRVLDMLENPPPANARLAAAAKAMPRP